MIYGYNPAYFLAFVLILLQPFGVRSTRIIRSWRAGPRPQLESLFHRMETSHGLAWPYI